MGHVAPPQQHVGIVQHLLGQSVLRLVQGSRAHLHVRFLAQKARDHRVDALWIYLLDGFLRFFIGFNRYLF